MKNWTFLTNHAHVLLCLAADPDALLKNVAHSVGITERATQRIVADLASEGYLRVLKSGRRNSYRINSKLHFRHPIERRNQIGKLLALL